MAWEICEDSIAKGDLTTNSTNHLAVATMNEYFKTFSRENRLKIRFDFIITRISAEEAKAQVMPIKLFPYPRFSRCMEKKP